ncbi:MAG: AAA family ATPase [Proteobacteria bacterium]|nr:AAA family ATPase [Pseudomonadota bacterium]
MYLSHFGLNQSPFGITPNPIFFFAGNKRGAILEALLYAVTNGEGIVKVTGEVGSGKTMLCRMLESMLPDNIEVIYLVNPTLGREEVVYAIAGELGLPTDGKRPDEMIRALQNDLIAKHVAGKQVVLLVEEAQAMPLDTLEEIRLFSNLETAHHKLLQIVLFGQPELDQSLQLPRMRQLKERITHSFEVPPLEPKTIPEYLMFRMRAAGYHGPDIFSKGAIRHITTVSEGIVRRISILADKALLAAFADNTHAIEARHVKAAIQDSEFSASAKARQRRNIILALILASALFVVSGLAWHFSRPTVPGTPLAHPVTEIGATPATSTATTATTVSTTLPAVAAPANAAESKKTIPAASILQQRLESTKAWIDAEAPKRFTVEITLVEANSRIRAEQALLARETELGADQIHVFPTRIGGRPRYGFTHGSYATISEAIAARDKLAKQWGYRPQIRTINSIRQEIDKTRSADLWQQQ